MKSIHPEDTLQWAIEELGQEIVVIEHDPEDWGERVGFLFDQFEDQTEQIKRINRHI